MKLEKLFRIVYLQHNVFENAKKIETELTQRELVKLISDGMVTLIEVETVK